MASRYDELPTEQINPASAELDRMSTANVLRLINQEDTGVAPAVAQALPAIAATVDAVAQCLGRGGRLFYVGAGTSGRLGVLDAAECPPTFGTDPQQVQGIMAGGTGALVRAVEGAEDDAEAGRRAMADLKIGPHDFVLGISASGVTPFVRGALGCAGERGARTGFLVCNEALSAEGLCQHTIAVPVGPEVIAGSTRMKAGTATKMVLNMISTTAMIRLGKVYGNFMVDLTPTCHKLRQRYRRILRQLAQADENEADLLMQQAGNRLKVALLMKLRGISAEEARERLDRAKGFLRKALEE